MCARACAHACVCTCVRGCVCMRNNNNGMHINAGRSSGACAVICESSHAVPAQDPFRCISGPGSAAGLLSCTQGGNITYALPVAAYMRGWQQGLPTLAALSCLPAGAFRLRRPSHHYTIRPPVRAAQPSAVRPRHPPPHHRCAAWQRCRWSVCC